MNLEDSKKERDHLSQEVQDKFNRLQELNKIIYDEEERPQMEKKIGLCYRIKAFPPPDQNNPQPQNRYFWVYIQLAGVENGTYITDEFCEDGDRIEFNKNKLSPKSLGRNFELVNKDKWNEKRQKLVEKLSN